MVRFSNTLAICELQVVFGKLEIEISTFLGNCQLGF